MPGAATQVALREGHSSAEAARIASWATMLLATGTILGCLIMAPLANWLGRRGALAFYFATHGGFDLTRLWLHLLSRARWLARIHRVPVCRWSRRRKFCRATAVAAGTISQ